MTLRYPYNAGAWIAAAVTVAVFAGFMGWFLGLDLGYHQGQRETVARLKPDIEANAANLSALSDRLIRITEAMRIETLASYYGEDHRGKRTASGAPFDPDELTAASPWLPFGSRWRVTRIDTGASVVVTITDRGPHPRLGRGLDLSRAAAAKLGMLRKGVVPVWIEPEVKT
jgi:rare lipoprotein A